MNENIEKVRTMLDKPELLCQLAEECTELGKAALKLRRVLAGINPTPLTEEEARKNFTEEVSDIVAVLKVLDVPVESEEIHGIQIPAVGPQIGGRKMQSTPNILKALKICASSGCNECPYYKCDNCAQKMHDDAHALISDLLADKKTDPESNRDPEAPAEPWTREKILAEAQKCVCGQWEKDYGTPENSFETIGRLWGAFLFEDLSITPHTVAVMMALMKIARIEANPGHMDSWVDLAGYAACGGEIAGKKA